MCCIKVGLWVGAPMQAMQPRLLLCGADGAGQRHLAPAVLYALEGLPVHALGLPALLSDASARCTGSSLPPCFLREHPLGMRCLIDLQTTAMSHAPMPCKTLGTPQCGNQRRRRKQYEKVCSV